MAVTEHRLLGECVICGEDVFSDDDPAEMHNPLKAAFDRATGEVSPDKWYDREARPQSGICHGQCGLGRGWVVS